MIRKALLGSMILVLAGCAGEETLQTREPFDAATTAKIDSAIEKVLAEAKCPGAVVRIDIPSKGFYFRGIGEQNTATHAAMSTDLHFRIGSNTKSFVGTVVLQLVDEKLLTLDQKIGTILEGVPNGDKITIRQMLSMTSGLPNYSTQDAFNESLWSDPHRKWTRQQLLDLAYTATPKTPGTEWEYSNTNTVLLGMVIEKLTGKTVAENFTQRIYKPVGMTETSWPTTEELPAPFSRGYTDDTRDRSIADATNWSPTWADAAGVLISTAEDMAKYAKAAGSGSLISKDMQTERLTWVTLPGTTGHYGLAIGETAGWIHHQGELPGYNTIAAYMPAKDATLVLLTNSNTPNDGTGPAAKLAMALIPIISAEEQGPKESAKEQAKDSTASTPPKTGGNPPAAKG